MEQNNNVCVDRAVYSFLKSKCESFKDMNAISFYNTDISYSQLFVEIEKMAVVLKNFGIKKGDVIVVSLPAIPEAVYLFYAANKLGAVYCGMDCRNTEEENQRTIDHVNPKICFVSDFHLFTFKNIDSPTVVYVNPAHSVGGFVEKSGLLADFFKGRLFLKARKNNVYRYKEFLNKYGTGEFVEDEKVSGDDECAYFYTSGTTHGKKCVIITNKNMNSAMHQHEALPERAQKGDRILSIMPLFTCYGIIHGTHFPLCIGLEVRLTPLFNGAKMKEILLKEHPNSIITVPGHWDTFLNENFENCDLSFLKTVIVAGDKMFPENINKINSIFKEHGSTAFLMNGYGMTETCSTGVVKLRGMPIECAGKVCCDTRMKVIDSETLKEVPFGEQGEICIHGPSVCKGYLKDEKATKELLKVHDDGLVWLHTGDIGYMDENDSVYFCERKKRMYVRNDGTKVSPYAIEQILIKCPIVETCLVAVQKDEKHEHGMYSVAVVVLKKDTNQNSAQDILEKYAAENIAEYMRPERIKIVEELPKTKLNKVDYFIKEI